MGPCQTERLLKAKDTVKRTKEQPADWENSFTNPTTNRELVIKYAIAGGIARWYNHSGNQSGGSSENWK